MRWKLVPVEPTEEMQKAGATSMLRMDGSGRLRDEPASVLAVDSYRAMLAAAPAAPEAPSDAAARGAQSLNWILDELRNGEATDHDIARRLVDAEPDIRAALAALRGQTGGK
jgi:hypothetical protein